MLSPSPRTHRQARSLGNLSARRPGLAVELKRLAIASDSTTPTVGLAGFLFSRLRSLAGWSTASVRKLFRYTHFLLELILTHYHNGRQSNADGYLNIGPFTGTS
jgi:hypothetical protein